MSEIGKDQGNKEAQLIQNNNNAYYNDSNQHINQPFNNIKDPLTNNENIQINLNQQNQYSLSHPFTDNENNNNIQQNANTNENFQNNAISNSYNPNNYLQMNSQPNFQQNQVNQVQERNRRCKCTYLDIVAAIMGGILGGFIISMPFKSLFF